MSQQFYAAFQMYATAPRTDIGALCNAVDRLAGLIEPFLKKSAFHFRPAATIVKQTRSGSTDILLWKTADYADILEAFGIIQVATLRNDKDSFWAAEPASLGILRAAFSARHKGVHESRMRTLRDLEDTAYSVLGQFVVVSLHLLRDQSITDQVATLTENARVSYLLHERAQMYPLAKALLSRREHLLLYRHREKIHPDESEQRFLFLNYLARRGPCFFWLRGREGRAMQWARLFSTVGQSEEIRRNAVAYLLEQGEHVAMSDLLDMFDAYGLKQDLAKYMAHCATARDRSLLVSLVNDKREEVALEARHLLSRFKFTRSSQLKTCARSTSDRRVSILRLVVPGLAREKDLEKYRQFHAEPDLAQRVIDAYCLGEVGSEEDLPLLRCVLSIGRLDRRLKSACLYATARICCRAKRVSAVRALVRGRDRLACYAALDALTREGLGTDLSVLWRGLRLTGDRLRKVAAAIQHIAEPRDRRSLRSLLTSVKIDNDSRDVLLALCKVGYLGDGGVILDLIGKARHSVVLYNHVRVANAVASICGPRLRAHLRHCIRSNEFWNYIPPQAKRTKTRLPIVNPENQALMRRLIGASFIRGAQPRDVRLLKRLLTHNYDWIAMQAAEKLALLGGESDLMELNEKLLKMPDAAVGDERVPVLEALCMLDRKLYDHSREVRT
ncbi:MAG: hypothetical protein ACLQU3_25970 [Limisphaerales bacterium]